MDLSLFSHPIFDNMKAGRLTHDWAGLATGLTQHRRGARDQSLNEEHAVDKKGFYALRAVELEWIISGASLLAKGNSHVSFGSKDSIDRRLSEANAAGSLLERISHHAHWLGLTEDPNIPKSPRVEVNAQGFGEKLIQYWSQALGEVGGNRSRLPSADHLVEAVRQENGVLSPRIEKILRNVFDPPKIV